MSFDYYEGKRKEGFELACELMLHGATARQVSENLGISKECAYKWRKRMMIDSAEQLEECFDSDEMKKKLELLKSYQGIWCTGPYIENKDEKMKKAKELYEKGYSVRRIGRELGVTARAAERWLQTIGCKCVENKKEKELPKGLWVEKWCKEWDEFVGSLKRPLRIKVVDK